MIPGIAGDLLFPRKIANAPANEIAAFAWLPCTINREVRSGLGSYDSQVEQPTQQAIVCSPKEMGVYLAQQNDPRFATHILWSYTVLDTIGCIA